MYQKFSAHVRLTTFLGFPGHLSLRTCPPSLHILQVFIIAGRESIDFAIFLLFILILLGSACFAFFQISGGNPEFVRFADGLRWAGLDANSHGMLHSSIHV